jgi:hypothetical protein
MVECAICEEERNVPGEGFVCKRCDRRAKNADGDRPWHGWPPGDEPEPKEGVIQMAPDAGENPVFIDGQKCWRRYRFGGWVTKVDENYDSAAEAFGFTS